MGRADAPAERAEHILEPSEAEEGADSLYRRYAGWLRAALRRRFGSTLGHLTEDLVQETYLRAARIQEPVRHPQALLMQIASRLAYDETRRRAEPAGHPDPGPQEPEAACDQAEALLLKQIILSLPEAYRDVFVLSRFGGLTYAEIAERCGLTVKAVEWRIARALAHCAAKLER